MKINNVTILNWEPLGNPPGTEWWKNVEAKPDEPLIEARIDFKLSHREYHKLLDQSKMK